MEGDKPLLSVLVPAYNAESYINSCINSLLVQTYDRIEVLICDDGSTDKTWLLMNGFDDVRISLYRNTQNRGKNQTCSFLLGKAKGEFVTVHDADDISSPSRFEKQMDFLIQHRDYVMCGTNFISFLDSGKVISKSDLATDYDAIRELIKNSSQFHGPTIVLKKAILADVGGFYRYFTRAEDIDLTMRITEKFKVANLPAHLYFYRHQPFSLTNDINGYSVERLAHFSLLYYLAEERRKNNGVDSLMTGNTEKVARLVNQFEKEYETDTNIALRRGVFRLLHMKMYRNALLLSWKTVRREASVLNIKCFLYALWQSMKGTLALLWQTEKVDLSFLSSVERLKTEHVKSV